MGIRKRLNRLIKERIGKPERNLVLEVEEKLYRESRESMSLDGVTATNWHHIYDILLKASWQANQNTEYENLVIKEYGTRAQFIARKTREEIAAEITRAIEIPELNYWD